MTSASGYLSGLFGMAGRIAVVTGASSGLGAEIARALARAGGDVIAVARRQHLLESLATEAESMEGNIVACGADLTTPSGLAAVESAVVGIGGCDILVANAGVLERAPLEGSTSEPFHRLFNINCVSPLELSKSLLPFLKKSRAGRVINVASIFGVGAPVRDGVGPYTTSKHALVGLTKTQAIEWAQFGITANAIVPGYHYTEMTSQGLNDPQVSARLKAFVPMGRFGQPNDVVTAVLFLASPASSYVTGITLPVDGGWTSW